jgi:predicted  nucleic acid-binding Zn-ribbon protein
MQDEITKLTTNIRTLTTEISTTRAYLDDAMNDLEAEKSKTIEWQMRCSSLEADIVDAKENNQAMQVLQSQLATANGMLAVKEDEVQHHMQRASVAAEELQQV